jgi:APA family basic amino acid/polyamine antiporter
VANALMALGLPNVMKWVSIGALTGMISSMLVFQLGQARVWFAMSRDGLLPQVFSKVHARFLTPHISTWVAGFFVAIPAGMFDIGTLADLSNIGTLFAFVLVSLGVLVLRRTQPERRRSFRTPWVPVVPILSILSCVILMASLPLETWVRFVVWLIIGLVIYVTYSRHHSEFGGAPRTPAKV